MYLDEINAAKIAAHFGNKFQCVSYAGCWSKDTVTFGVYQTKEQLAGFELTIKGGEGHLQKIEVVSVKRLGVYSRDADNQFRRKALPIYINQQL